MTISPSLSAQFARLANWAVVTNVIPYIFCALSLKPLLKAEGITNRECNKSMSSFLAGVSLIYCLYALTTITFATFLGGAFVLFIGWLTYMIRFNILKTNFIINQEAK